MEDAWSKVSWLAGTLDEFQMCREMAGFLQLGSPQIFVLLFLHQLAAWPPSLPILLPSCISSASNTYVQTPQHTYSISIPTTPCKQLPLGLGKCKPGEWLRWRGPWRPWMQVCVIWTGNSRILAPTEESEAELLIMVHCCYWSAVG